jgi:hypothetical protein
MTKVYMIFQFDRVVWRRWVYPFARDKTKVSAGIKQKDKPPGKRKAKAFQRHRILRPHYFFQFEFPSLLSETVKP